MSYQQVKTAMEKGADPRMLCETCPWDRHCVKPPAMSSGDIKQLMRESREGSEKEDPGSAMFKGLLTAVTFGGRDTMEEMCPVFAARLRSSSGFSIAQLLKEQMKAWDDSVVPA